MMSRVWAVFGKPDIEPRHREIAILFTGRRMNADYMWQQHLAISPLTGVTAI